jgi:hypothetical protein
MASATHVGFTFFLDTLEGAFGRLDKKRGLVSSTLVFGMLVTLISKGNSVRFCFRVWQAKSEAAPATVGGESFFGVPLGFLDNAREGEEGLRPASQETGLNKSSFRRAVRAHGAVFRCGDMNRNVSRMEGPPWPRL